MGASKVVIGATLGALSIVATGAFVTATVSAVSIVMAGTVSLIQHDPAPIVSAGSAHTNVAYGAAPFRIVDSSARTIAAAARGASVR
jgi:tetrahydrodipicolinate N-succinyltransferase